MLRRIVVALGFACAASVVSYAAEANDDPITPSGASPAGSAPAGEADGGAASPDAGSAGAPSGPAVEKDEHAPIAAPPTNDAPPKDATDDDSGIDYTTPRLEPAGLPLIGGNSDIGVQIGAAGRITRFANGAKPFVYRIDFLATTSIRDNGDGLGFGQQEYLGQLDLPNLFGGRVRTIPGAQFLDFVDAGYFGRGNDSSSTVPEVVDGERRRFFQQRAREFRVRNFTRIRIKKPVDLMIAPIVRFHDHEAYAGSKLALDVERGVARGLRPVLITSLAVGIVIDTRDNEFFPRRGMYHQIGTRFAQGFPVDGDVQMGSTGAMLAGYVPLGGPFVAAGRMVLDFQYGKIPYYDLYNAGPFNEWEMPGGANGIRGVPWGRYSGPIKTIGNVELRALWLRFGFLGERFRIGNDVFFDTGRVFDDYRFDAPRDGKGLGLKWGTGIGTYLMWGEGALFRVELAYSPDSVRANPSFPLGLYLADGVMF